MSKRVMIAGTGSGCGKTTITCALLAALAAKGMRTAAFKCGPDYIDPMFHKAACGQAGRNLDVFLMGEEGVKQCVKRHTEQKDIAIMEGAMGLYDGLGDTGYASANHVSRLTNTPVILAVNAKGASLSVCALIKGFLELERNHIRGVILNNISEKMFAFYKQMIEKRLNIPVIGFMPHNPYVRIESRHLGLITADEIGELQAKIDVLRDCALAHVELDALIRIAEQAEDFDAEDLLPAAKHAATVYVARDEAFCFAYEDNHDLLRAMGADLRFFSPIHDRELPKDADGLVLWGGYPELYACALAENEAMRRSLKAAIEAGLPVYAECGGFLYMQQSLRDLNGKAHGMLGVLDGNAAMTEKLQRIGYYEIQALRDNLLCEKGGAINAHFFHYSTSDKEGDAFLAVKQSGASFPCVAAKQNIFAGYQHLHFWENAAFVERFLSACEAYGRRKA